VSEHSKEPMTRGIAPATGGALAVLQHEPLHGGGSHVQEAAREIASYHAMDPDGDQANRLTSLAVALADFLEDIVRLSPPGPERSTAISRAREAKFWASAAIALEGH
jgi:hypothetical protein